MITLLTVAQTIISILLASVLLTAVVMVSRALWDSVKDADR